MKFFFFLALLGTLIGSFILISTLMQAKGAPQEAAGAAIALCFGVLPYVFARCVEKMGGPREVRIVENTLELSERVEPH